MNNQSSPPSPREDKPGAQRDNPAPDAPLGLEEYLGDFMVEFSQNLENMKKSLALLKFDPSTRPELDALYRSAHNLKGGANALGFLKLGEFLRNIEASMEPFRKGAEPFTMDSAAALEKAVATLEKAAYVVNNSKTDFTFDFGPASEALRWAMDKNHPRKS